MKRKEKIIMVKMFSKKDIHESLRQVMNLNLQINAKTKELARWREISEKASGIVYSHAKSGTKGGSGSRIEDCIIKIDAIEQSLRNDISSLLLLKARISNIINKISDPACKSLLSLRYLSGMNWEEVADFMVYSYVHIVHRLHPKALEKFGEYIKIEEEKERHETEDYK